MNDCTNYVNFKKKLYGNIVLLVLNLEVSEMQGKHAICIRVRT